MADDRKINKGVRVTGTRRTYRPGEEGELEALLTPKELRDLLASGQLSGTMWKVKGKDHADRRGSTAVDPASQQPDATLRAGEIREAQRKAGTTDRARGTNPQGAGPVNETPDRAGSYDPPLDERSKAQLLLLATGKGVDVDGLEGTGARGNVLVEDLIRAIEARDAELAEDAEREEGVRRGDQVPLREPVETRTEREEPRREPEAEEGSGGGGDTEPQAPAGDGGGGQQ